MTAGLPEIPEDIEDKLPEPSNDRDVQDHHIIATFLEEEKPFLSVRRLATEHDMSRNGMRKRLQVLEDLGVLKSGAAANGDVYWIRDEKSEWPIPPDVEVSSKPDQAGPPVSEWFERKYVQFWLLAVVAAIAGSFSLTVFTTIAFFEMNLPLELGEKFLLVGLLAAMASVGFAFIGGAFYAYGAFTSPESTAGRLR